MSVCREVIIGATKTSFTHAAALYYGVNIYIWRSADSNPTVFSSSSGDRVINLGYVNHISGQYPNHYVSLHQVQPIASSCNETDTEAKCRESNTSQTVVDYDDEDCGDTDSNIIHQPNIIYPANASGRSFTYNWYSKWPWLHWDDKKNAVLCHPCSRMAKLNIKSWYKKSETAFSVDGFTNWRDPTRSFTKHESSAQHKESVLKWTSHCQKVNVASQIKTELCNEQHNNRENLMKILSTIKYLARQGLALRGHKEDTGNFIELLKLRSEDTKLMTSWLTRKTRFCSHEIQNEMLNLMSQHVLRGLVTEMKAHKYFAIICDEVTDEARQQHLGISARWTDSDFNVSEDFLGLYAISRADAHSLSALIQDALLRLSLDITDCRAQCYDGASVMSGHISGVSQRLMSIESRIIYIHCFAHSLNLAVQSTARNIPLFRNMFDYLKDIINIIRASPKRTKIFCDAVSEHQSPSRKSLRPLCPTRWTTRFQSIDSLLENYESVMATLFAVAEEDKTEAGTKAGGLLAHMEKFDFLFSLMSSSELYRMTDELSKILQSSDITVTEAAAASRKVLSCIMALRTDEHWCSLWQRCLKCAENMHVSQPVVPTCRRAPRKLDSGSDPVKETAESYYRRLFCELVDTAHSAIEARLSQKSLSILTDIEQLLLSGASGREIDSEITGRVVGHFKGDINEKRLQRQLEMLPDVLRSDTAPHSITSVDEIKDKILQLGAARHCFSEVTTLIRLLLVVPASSATAERSFSSLRRLKNYLRTTMTQQRLNSLLLLHTHQDRTDKLDLMAVARDFIVKNEQRRLEFGHF